MKTNTHPNSIESYRGINLSRRQHEVVMALQCLGQATDQQIAEMLGYTTNRVTGRITELREKGIVIEADTTVGTFGKKVRVCRLAAHKETLFD